MSGFYVPYLENTGIWSMYTSWIPCHFTGRHIPVNFSGCCFLALLRWYVLMMATRQVSLNGELTVAAALPRPSSGEGYWTVHGLCSAAGGGEDKRLCVTEGWKKRIRNKEKIDYLPVRLCAWVVSQCFPLQSLASEGISNLRPVTCMQWF